MIQLPMEERCEDLDVMVRFAHLLIALMYAGPIVIDPRFRTLKYTNCSFQSKNDNRMALMDKMNQVDRDTRVDQTQYAEAKFALRRCTFRRAGLASV